MLLNMYRAVSTAQGGGGPPAGKNTKTQQIHTAAKHTTTCKTSTYSIQTPTKPLYCKK